MILRQFSPRDRAAHRSLFTRNWSEMRIRSSLLVAFCFATTVIVIEAGPVSAEEESHVSTDSKGKKSECDWPTGSFAVLDYLLFCYHCWNSISRSFLLSGFLCIYALSPSQSLIYHPSLWSTIPFLFSASLWSTIPVIDSLATNLAGAFMNSLFPQVSKAKQAAKKTPKVSILLIFFHVGNVFLSLTSKDSSSLPLYPSHSLNRTKNCPAFWSTALSFSIGSFVTYSAIHQS